MAAAQAFTSGPKSVGIARDDSKTRGSAVPLSATATAIVSLWTSNSTYS
jgi:hypothetical protein